MAHEAKWGGFNGGDSVIPFKTGARLLSVTNGGNGNGRLWRWLTTFLAGVVVALCGTWAVGLQARASNEAQTNAQIQQLLQSQQQEQQEIKDLTVANWANQQAIAVLTQRLNDLVQRLER